LIDRDVRPVSLERGAPLDAWRCAPLYLDRCVDHCAARPWGPAGDRTREHARSITVTIVRVGATKKYTDGWEAAFGKAKKRSATAPSSTTKRKKSAAKKSAAASTKKKARKKGKK
jgi:hypothetical protein